MRPVFGAGASNPFSLQKTMNFSLGRVALHFFGEHGHQQMSQGAVHHGAIRLFNLFLDPVQWGLAIAVDFNGVGLSIVRIRTIRPMRIICRTEKAKVAEVRILKTV